MRCRILMGVTLAAAAVLAVTGPIAAQEWPTKGVRFVVPLGPGSASDIGARLIAEKLQARWSRSVVVENRPGADALIALGAFVGANDDHVLFYGGTASFLVHPYRHDKLPYDLKGDLLPIARTTITLSGIGVPAASGISTLKEFVARARAEPGKLNAAIVSGLSELIFDYFLKEENVVITKVPYRDVVQAGTDLGENRIQFMAGAIAILRPHIDGGRVKLVAVSTKAPTPLLPGIPTTVEAGVPSLEAEGLNGLFGPKGMELNLRERIGSEVVTALGDAAVLAKLGSTAQGVSPGGPADLLASMSEQIAQIDRTAKAIGLERKLKQK